MNHPENLKYTKEHEWVRVEGNGIAVIGITDFAQSELGELVYIEVDTVGDSIGKDEVFGTVEAVKTVSDLFMPVTGEILELNDELESSPELVNDAPYTEGWMVKVKLTGPLPADLLDAAAYKELIGE